MDEEKPGGGRFILAIVGACVLALGIAGIWHEGLGGEDPIEVSAADLAAAYIRNAAEADQRFGGSPLLVAGMSGATQIENGEFILTLLPGIRAHLGSETSGADLFQKVTVLCDGVTFSNGVIDLEGCQISAAPQGSDAVAAIDEPACHGARYGHAPDRETALAFEAVTGHREGFCVVEEEAGRVITRPLRLLDMPFGNVLLTEREIEDGCHGCPGALGISYLAERNGKLQVKGRWPAIIEGGWGKPSEWSLTNDFTTTPAIYTESGDGGQGYQYGSATLTELTPNGPVTSYISTGYSDEGAQVGGLPCVLEGKIENVRKDQSFDVHVTGSREFTDHYIRKAGKFVEASERDWEEVCDY